MADFDAVVVGAGPNGLAAAVTLAAAGLRVQVIEGAATPGGGCRTEASTMPGFRHDVCSSVHPLAVASPFFAAFDLAKRGVQLRYPEIAFAQPLEGGRAALAYQDLARTVDELGPGGPSWHRLMAPLVRRADAIVPAVLAPLRSVPAHPFQAARFAWPAVRAATSLAKQLDSDEARALFAGVAAHAMLPLNRPPTAAFGALLGMLGHTVGWPLVEGGSDRITDALLQAVLSHGGSLETNHWVGSLDELPKAPAVLLDVAPRQFLDLAGDRLDRRFGRALRRFRYGPGVCKIDWALSGPVPWTAEGCRRAGTVHVGGTFDEVAVSESEVAAGRHATAPYVLVVQATVVDPSRAPLGQHTLWGYCHVPSGSTVDMTAAIEAQIERFAPGFRHLILARSVRTAVDEEHEHPNYIGGDIGVGASTVKQTMFRPTMRWDNYRTPLKGVYLCSSGTPPGGGVHGMCGHYAARSALRTDFGISWTPELAAALAAS